MLLGERRHAEDGGEPPGRLADRNAERHPHGGAAALAQGRAEHDGEVGTRADQRQREGGPEGEQKGEHDGPIRFVRKRGAGKSPGPRPAVNRCLP